LLEKGPEKEVSRNNPTPKTSDGTKQKGYNILTPGRLRSNSISGIIPSRKDGRIDSTKPEADKIPANGGNWTEVLRKKRTRDSPETSTKTSKQSKLSSYWLSAPVHTSNMFEALDPEEHMVTEPPVDKLPKPPPIYVDRVTNMQPLTELLNETVKRDYEIKVLRADEVKIQPKSAQAYTIIVRELKNKGTEFHTYKLKQERSFRVVLKNMHPSTDEKELKAAINSLGHQVTNVWNIKNRVTKKPLPMYFIDLKPNVNNKQIYDTKFHLNCRIIFEPPRPKRQIPQCARCQRYGHTRSFCYRKARCVKCAGDHATVDCHRKERSDQAKCVLCGGSHPANYKGCSVYKELQKLKFPQLRPKKIPTARPGTQPSRTFAEAAVPNLVFGETKTNATTHQENEQPNEQNRPQSNIVKELQESLQSLTRQMTAITNTIAELVSKIAQCAIH